VSCYCEKLVAENWDRSGTHSKGNVEAATEQRLEQTK
jgi:hypothetical protein